MGSGVTRGGTARVFEPARGHGSRVATGTGAGVDPPTRELQIEPMYGQNGRVLAELWSKR
jgi:hypothetical protein